MLIVREVFTAKPGMASKLAKMFKKMMDSDPSMASGRVLTDMVGDYNTVVMEMSVASLAEWEQMIADYKSGKAAQDPAMAEEWASYTTMWKTGRREIWQVME